MGDVAQLAALEEEATIRAVPRNMTLPFADIALDRLADIGNFIGRSAQRYVSRYWKGTDHRNKANPIPNFRKVCPVPKSNIFYFAIGAQSDLELITIGLNRIIVNLNFLRPRATPPPEPDN